jgi:hypothetical protein
MVSIALASLLAIVAGALAATVYRARKRGLDRWLAPYILEAGKRREPGPDDTIHVLLCIADHFEPKSGGASGAKAASRVERWVHAFPRQFGTFRDSDGRRPRYTFFYPIEEYEPAYLDMLAGLCRAGFGEIEIHLHHDRATAAGLREQLSHFKTVLAERHGMLARSRHTGELAYGFIHGNWALCNSRPDGRWCGVNEELAVLYETGCYADFTMPSAPHVTQTRKINSIYYAVDRPGQARSHDTGIDAGSGERPKNGLLLIQGPLLYDWRRRRAGLVPRLENGCIQGSQPPSIDRLAAWLKARVQVPGRPDWFFVKLHAHGAEEASSDKLLGEPMVQFHRDLAGLAEANPRFHFHYVSARELANLARAAEAGWTGTVVDALDYEWVWNGQLVGQAAVRADQSAIERL